MLRTVSLALVVSLFGSAAVAGEWFLHPFGELRAYHDDWLAVCDDDGRGACRVVRAQADSGSGAFFDARLSLHRGDGGWWIEVMDRGMPEQALTALSFDFGAGRVVALAPGDWFLGELRYANVAETVTVTDPAIVEDLIARLQAGRVVLLRYAPVGAGAVEAFPLRGITAAMAAVETLREERGQ
ncbi:MAG: hypothetical protein AAFO58_00745 [Pseudomonadota bacterium]